MMKKSISSLLALLLIAPSIYADCTYYYGSRSFTSVSGNYTTKYVYWGVSLASTGNPYADYQSGGSVLVYAGTANEYWNTPEWSSNPSTCKMANGFPGYTDVNHASCTQLGSAPLCTTSGSGYFFDGNGIPISTSMYLKTIMTSPGALIGTGLLMNGVIFTGAAFALGGAMAASGGGLTAAGMAIFGIANIGAGLVAGAYAVGTNTTLVTDNAQVVTETIDTQGSRIKISLKDPASSTSDTVISKTDATTGKITEAINVPKSTVDKIQNSSAVTTTGDNPTSSYTQSDIAYEKTTYDWNTNTYQTTDQAGTSTGSGSFSSSDGKSISSVTPSSGNAAPVIDGTTGSATGGTSTTPSTPTTGDSVEYGLSTTGDNGYDPGVAGDVTNVDTSSLEQIKNELSTFVGNVQNDVAGVATAYSNAKTTLTGGFNTSELQLSHSAASCNLSFQFHGQTINVPTNFLAPLGSLFYFIFYVTFLYFAIRIGIRTVELGNK